MRAILRVSISGEANGVLRNKLAGVAARYRFATEPGGQATGTWTNENITVADYGRFVRDYWSEVSGHPGPGYIDSIWSMVDNADPRERMARDVAQIFGER